MSHHVVSEVHKRDVGKLAHNAVLALMADKASDDGRGIWASKQTIADELGCTKQTVLSTIEDLIAKGLLIVVGEQPCANGHTIEYRIDVAALEALPLVGCHARKASKKLTGQKSGPVNNIDPTGQKSGPHQSKILTQTILEPSLNLSPPAPRCRGGSVERAVIPENWVCGGVDGLPPKIAALARQWPAGAFEAEAEAFHQHWRGRGQRRANWAALWAARVQARHEAVMRSAKAGVEYAPQGGQAAPPVESVRAKGGEDALSAELHAALAERLGRTVWQRWFDPVALIFEEAGLAVIAPSAFHAGQIEQHHSQAITQALDAIGRAADWISIRTERKKGARRG